ncbi:MAG: MMPL family transporter [Motiliproteus sp.]|nr:MMPL family transporter [Motiliproteus sp.]MCW9053030.1 MMPL family transporter [Motiliproteus sp.]
MNALFHWVLKRKFIVLLISLVLITLAASGGRFLVFKGDYRVFFGEENPQLLAFERMQKTFAKSDNVLFILAPKNGDIFTSENLAIVEQLTEASWQLPYSTRVDSITNFQHTYAEEDDMIVEDLAMDSASLDQEQIERVRSIATQEPLLVNRLVSPDGQVAAVNVLVTLPGKNLIEEFPEVASATRELRDQILAQHPEMTIYLSGMVMMNTSFSESALNDSSTLIPLMFIVVIVFIGVLIRTFIGTLATLVIIIASIAGAMGLSGWSGLYLTGPSSSAPTVILTLAVADCVHILTTLYHEMRMGIEKRQAILNSLKINSRPVILTSVTTAIGFLSMNFSDSPPFADLGNIVATGVMLACVLSLTLFPAMLMMMPLKVSVRTDDKSSFMDHFSAWVIRQRRPLFWICVAIIAVSVSQIPRNELNDNFVEYFDTSVPFRNAADFSDKHLTGLSVMEFELNSQEASGINEPQFMQRTADFVAWLRQQPETAHVDTLSDTMKRLNKNMHGDDESYYKLPDNRELAAQYLLLYEMSLPYGLDLNNQINVNKSAIRVVATYSNLTSNQMLDLELRANNWLQQNAPELKTSNTSPSLMFSHIGKRNIESMLLGTLFALLLISVLLGIALKSVKYGFLSLIPNLAPAAIAFGLWGMTVGEVGLALSVVTGMTLGIVVDDTVHFLSKYLHARRERGEDPTAAVRYAFNSVGKALWITTLVLAAGFMVLAQSSFKVNADMGLLTAITIVIALIMDFLLLPALLLLIDRKPKSDATITIEQPATTEAR